MTWKTTVSIYSVLVLVWAVCVVVSMSMFGVWARLETGNWVKYDITIEPLALWKRGGNDKVVLASLKRRGLVKVI